MARALRLCLLCACSCPLVLLARCFARFRRREIEAGETAALITLRDRIERVRARENLSGVVLGVLTRLIAKTFGSAVIPAIVPIAACIRRHAPHHLITDIGHVDRLLDQMQQIVEAKPCAQVPELGRLLDATADPHADALDAMLVPVQTRNAFAPHLAQAIEAVRTELAV